MGTSSPEPEPSGLCEAWSSFASFTGIEGGRHPDFHTFAAIAIRVWNRVMDQVEPANDLRELVAE